MQMLTIGYTQMIRLGMLQSLTENSANLALTSNNAVAWLIKAVTKDAANGSNWSYEEYQSPMVVWPCLPVYPDYMCRL